ncbi:energy transducer TonB, partial [Aquitalea magnusonii]|uniref:energy transducer TonB n=1 Tax=Aquitalea magnusonii TaxID=332411 RepID=UPI00128F39F4
ADTRVQPVSAEPAQPPQPPSSEPGFAADYLHNPAPGYPPASRRNGEEGRVLLRVRVSAAGLAEAVEVYHGSGFSRLDEAAREVVAGWRLSRRGAVAARLPPVSSFRLLFAWAIADTRVQPVSAEPAQPPQPPSSEPGFAADYLHNP